MYYMIIKDTMVLIHLAKITLLEKSCEYFVEVIIPNIIYEEIMRGKQKGFEDANIIEDLIAKNKIMLKKINDRKLLEKAKQYNIQRGEAEALALYWQEKADLLATDDDNVRKKATILNLKIIGTPSIITKLYKTNNITKEKYLNSVNELRKIGWFSNQMIDKMKDEAA